MNPATLSGLELLEAAARADPPPAAMGQTMGMRLMAVSEGHVLFHAVADERHLNPLGAVHGGFAATLLDSATGCAVHTMLGAGVGYGTVDLAVKMLRPVPRGQTLVAEARVVHVSRTIGVAEGSLKTQDGKLLATGYATCVIQRPS